MSFCHLYFTCENDEITREIIFDLPGWQNEVVEHVWAKQAKGPGGQEMAGRQTRQIGYKIDTKTNE